MKKQIEKLKQELKVMTEDRDASIMMYQEFLGTSQERGKALSVVMPHIDHESLNEMLAELYDLRREKEELESKVHYFRSKKGRAFMGRVDKVGFCKALHELGEFKEDK